MAFSLRPPIVVILGAPAATARLVAELGIADVACFQMDLYQAERLHGELAELHQSAKVVAFGDLWDVGDSFQTALYPAAHGGERSLKLDMVEQAFHVLRVGGVLAVRTPYQRDELFPRVLKKVFGNFHLTAKGGEEYIWARREQLRARRRHEVVFQVAGFGEPALRFVSRPGVFSYGRMDEGARALLEAATIEPGDTILDIGCGCGTNGIVAARRAGPKGRVLFVDSNLRALALAADNASLNSVAHFETVPSRGLNTIRAGTCDVALANPPYYAQLSIARFFAEQCRRLLRPGGRLYLVTKLLEPVQPLVSELFEQVQTVSRRGYFVFCARVPSN